MSEETEMLRAELKVHDSTTRRYSVMHDAETMSTRIRTELDRRVAEEISDMVVQRLAKHLGMPTAHAEDFFEFLGQDPEIQDRFYAYVAGKRITQR